MLPFITHNSLDLELRYFRKCLVPLCGLTACTMQVVCSEPSEVKQYNIGSCYTQTGFIKCFILISFSVTRFSCLPHSTACPPRPQLKKLLSRCPITGESSLCWGVPSVLGVISWLAIVMAPVSQTQGSALVSVKYCCFCPGSEDTMTHRNYCIHRLSVARDTHLWFNCVHIWVKELIPLCAGPSSGANMGEVMGGHLERAPDLWPKIDFRPWILRECGDHRRGACVLCL